MKSCLLCVALFLLWPYDSSQKECNEPDDIDFGEIVSDEKAKYLENDRVQYKCNSGYLLEGSELIFCNGQEWTPPPPKCLAPCSITKQQLATKKLFLLGGRRSSQLIQSNHTLQFWCSKGYVLAGSSARMCIDGHMDLPLCISERGQNCSAPPMTENGDIITLSEKQYKSGSSVEYKCQQYYALEGQNRSFCDNGTWTNVPICLDPCRITRAEMESQKIEVKGKVDVFENIYIRYGDSIELTCKLGYALARNLSQSISVFHCDGTSSELPLCKEITCEAVHIEHGNILLQKNIYWEGDQIQFNCIPGFTHFDRQEAICTANGWSARLECKARGCDYIHIKNGRMSNYYETWKPFPRHEGQTIDYGCNSGYLAVNRDRWQRATCTKFGFDPEPKCFKTCDPSFRFQHGHFVYNYWSKFIEGDNITFSCDEGYYSAGQQLTARCTEDGWSPTPRCLQTDVGRKCGHPPSMENGDIMETPKAEYKIGEMVTYQCQSYYRMEGSPNVFCRNGHWSEIPTCIVPCTAGEEEMRRHNIQLKWKWSDKLYSEAGDTAEFTCKRGFYPDPHSQPFRVRCIDGKLEYPNCIQV